MTQEDKELLLKDLCARLPYGVCYKHFAWGDEREEKCVAAQIYSINSNGYVKNCYDDETDNIDNVRPYLFPLSSMTDAEQEELEQEHSKDEMLYIECLERAAKGDNSMRGKVITHYAMDWCNKNHFDYRGLIEKELAIDATRLNIY